MIMNNFIKAMLRAIAFVLTIAIVLYGLSKGFDTIELVLNFLYFNVIVITTFIDLLEQIIK